MMDMTTIIEKNLGKKADIDSNQYNLEMWLQHLRISIKQLKN